MSIIEELRNKCEDCKPISTLKVGKYEFCACVDEDEVNVCIAKDDEFLVCNARFQVDFLFLLSYFLLTIQMYGFDKFLSLNKLVEENVDKQISIDVSTNSSTIFDVDIERVQ